MNEKVRQYIIDAHRRGEAPYAIQAYILGNYGVTLTYHDIYDVFAEIDAGMHCVCGYIGDDFTQLSFSSRTHGDSSHEHDVDVWEKAEEEADTTVIFVCPKCGTLKIEI
jgi:hypothetical protein